MPVTSFRKKMKTSEEILLEEVRSEYSRQLAAWTELTHRSHNALQLNGLLLTVIFIGIGFQSSFREFSVMLMLSSACIVISIVLGICAARSESVKEIKVELDADSEIDDKQRDIMFHLIITYNTAQKDVIRKYNARKRILDWSWYLLSAGLVALLVFIVLFLM